MSSNNLFAVKLYDLSSPARFNSATPAAFVCHDNRTNPAKSILDELKMVCTSSNQFPDKSLAFNVASQYLRGLTIRENSFEGLTDKEISDGVDVLQLLASGKYKLQIAPIMSTLVDESQLASCDFPMLKVDSAKQKQVEIIYHNYGSTAGKSLSLVIDFDSSIEQLIEDNKLNINKLFEVWLFIVLSSLHRFTRGANDRELLSMIYQANNIHVNGHLIIKENGNILFDAWRFNSQIYDGTLLKTLNQSS